MECLAFGFDPTAHGPHLHSKSVGRLRILAVLAPGANARTKDPGHSFSYKVQEAGTYPYARGSDPNMLSQPSESIATVRAVLKRVRAEMVVLI